MTETLHLRGILSFFATSTSAKMRLSWAVAAASAVLLSAAAASAFVSPAPHANNKSPTALHLADIPLPFFAAVSESSKSPAGDASSTSATITTRLPLGTLFDGRDYIFNAATNVRGYEWDTKLVEELFFDLADFAISGYESPNKHRGDFELSQVVLVPTGDWDRATYGLGARYDVQDGQQRLVTLCLLFAAMRESFRGSEDAACVETIEELTSMLNPPKVRKAPVVRIELRKRENEMLQKILAPDLVDNELNIPTPESEEWNELSPTNLRILSNYNTLAERVSELSVKDRLEFLDYVIEHVYLLCCVPETATIARNIVMGQGKGMNTEAIDDFKGLVCFRYTSDEKDMYETFDQWDKLASTPDAELGSVGRNTVAAACVLRATAALQTKIRKNDEALSLENWLRKDLIENGYEGKEFYKNNVQPASRALDIYRDGSFDSFQFVVNSGKEDAELIKTIKMRLSFLRGLTSGVSATKEAQIVILDLLLRAEGDGTKALALDELDMCLNSIEALAIWMAISRPSPMIRNKRVFDILEIIDSGVLLDDMSDHVVSDTEKAQLKKDLSHFAFGASPAGKKLAITLLQRLNMHLLAGDGKQADEMLSHNHVEHVLPTNTYRKYWMEQWPDEEMKTMWTHLLGNLALMSRKSTAKESNNVFGEKKERYKKETAPLTNHIGSQIDVWNKFALAENHQKIVDLIGDTWGV